MEACAELQALPAAPAAPGAEVAGGRPSPCALGACAQSGRGLWPFPLCEVGTWGSRAPPSARWAAGGGASAGQAVGAGGWREFVGERAVLCAGAGGPCGGQAGGSGDESGAAARPAESYAQIRIPRDHQGADIPCTRESFITSSSLDSQPSPTQRPSCFFLLFTYMMVAGRSGDCHP
ncbi:uncharacterized protein [Dipodomys merriami]|uniref:uncharacterized protein n=1 Tax=Dipodomys merriami TaxID=94247 RepID=UPI003855B020